MTITIESPLIVKSSLFFYLVPFLLLVSCKDDNLVYVSGAGFSYSGSDLEDFSYLPLSCEGNKVHVIIKGSERFHFDPEQARI